MTAASDAAGTRCLLHKVHADEPEEAAVTAFLLLTDRRWRNATGRLVRRIQDSCLVPDDQLDLLAQTFLAAETQVYWEAPDEWFDGPTAVLGADDHDVAGVFDDGEREVSDDGPVVFAREIRPPLRRWGAARAVRSDPSRWAALVPRARQADPRGGAAIMHGLLDSIDLLAPAARDLVLDLAANWPHRKLREAATALSVLICPTPRTSWRSVAVDGRVRYTGPTHAGHGCSVRWSARLSHRTRAGVRLHQRPRGTRRTVRAATGPARRKCRARRSLRSHRLRPHLEPSRPGVRIAGTDRRRLPQWPRPHARRG